LDGPNGKCDAIDLIGLYLNLGIMTLQDPIEVLTYGLRNHFELSKAHKEKKEIYKLLKKACFDEISDRMENDKDLYSKNDSVALIAKY
jgi:hypothetical protein